MSAKTKLELTWIGKEHRPRLEPRILIEDEALSYHAPAKKRGDLFDNLLIQGDNLLALRALQASHSGVVDCIYIDPPYNTGSAFSHYDDGLEHSMWLTLIRDRLSILYDLLSDDGSIWVSIDDKEVAYLRILLDEQFGRGNFIACNVWQKRYSRENRGVIGDAHEYVVAYAKDIVRFKDKAQKIPMDEKSAAVYRNVDENGERWRAIPMTAQGYRPNQMYPITTPSGVVHRPPEGRCWSMVEAKYLDLLAQGRIFFGKSGDAQPSVIRYLKEVEGVTPWTWWPHDDCGHTDEAKKEIHALFGKEDAFATPKPERLIKRILDIATRPGEIVLDSFAGSGTTGAVAQKMGRRWIMVELGEHCETLIVPRLRKVIDGDQGGISKAVGWKGGGGYRYFRLAPSLLEKDRFGQWVISKAYNGEMLAEAMCKHFGFSYAPSDEYYWIHGHSSEADFIYVTTNSLTHEQLRAISDEVGGERSLLICCKAFQGANADSFTNLTIRKIPGAILDRCEWGKDDYSLKIEALPLIEDEPPEEGTPNRPRKGTEAQSQATLFDIGGEA
jgi:adenine-specific DNA-methyltransferase